MCHFDESHGLFDYINLCSFEIDISSERLSASFFWDDMKP